MACTRFLAIAILSVALLAAQRQTGLSQSSAAPLPTVPAPTPPKAASPKDPLPGVAHDMTCKVYSLSELGNDPSLGKWIAETIPEVIQPGSWSQTEPAQARRKINFHGPSQILVIYHTAAVHAKVEAFLNDLKNAMPADNTKTTGQARKLPMMARPVMQAGASTTDGVQFSGTYSSTPISKPAEPPAPPASGYPVAAPLKQPKHLFHFIIRYEGDGLIDANVVKFAKAVNGPNVTPIAIPQNGVPATAVCEPAAQNGGTMTRPATGTPAKPNTESSNAPPHSQAPPAQPPPAGLTAVPSGFATQPR